MRAFLRIVLLVLLAAGLAAPALASLAAAPGPIAADAPPCPSKRVVLKQCVVDPAAPAPAPRAGVSADAPCPMKAIEARAADPVPARTARLLAFEERQARWTGWIPPGIEPPPRS